MTLAEFFAVYVKFFFILTPFFVIAVFLAMTEYESDAVRRRAQEKKVGAPALRLVQAARSD